MFGRAMDLAARTEQYGALDLMAQDLNKDSDPRVLERCAEFFSQNQQYDKAVELLAYAKKVHIITKKVKINIVSFSVPRGNHHGVTTQHSYHRCDGRGNDAD